MTQLDLFVNGVSALFMRDDSIYFMGFNKTKYRTNTWKNMLGSLYIKNKEDLDKKCNWLLTEGLRFEFNRMWYVLRTFNEIERKKLVESTEENDDALPNMKMIHKQIHSIPAGGIVAFDMAEYFMIIKAGKEVGYIEESEAGKRLLLGVQKLQESYSSWEEFVIGYVFGAQFKSVNALDGSYVRSSMKYVKRLLTSRHSPFNQVDWNVNLSS